MRGLFRNSTRAGRRSMLKLAVVGTLLASMVGGPANAGWGSLLYSYNYTVAAISQYNNWVLVKATPYKAIQPATNYVTVQWSCWKGGPYNCATRAIIYNPSGNWFAYAEHDGTPNNETSYYTTFYVGSQPGYAYTVELWIRDPQTSNSWIYYGRIFQVVDGIVPMGNYASPVYNPLPY